MKEQIKILKKHILTGTSHMIPFIVAGGILISISELIWQTVWEQDSLAVWRPV